MPRQMAQQEARFSAEDFFEDYESEYNPKQMPYTQGSLAVEVEVPERIPDRRRLPKQQKSQKRVQKTVSNTRQRVRKAIDMAQIKSKFNFFLCAGLVLAGCMAVVLMYVQVFNQETQIEQLKGQLTAARDANAIAQETVIEQMTMADLYSYATGELGMVEADGNTTIRIKVENQSYTTSSLPIENASESKVSFHWFG
ncbi:MAG: hypothetical protein HFE64_02810 [Lachnospiraceae bacterium]|jgi:hypothetical protein|nr:hypothetical protein [Lachnospiraceae bacterium]